MKNKNNSITIWITGLSASGKTTLANSIKKVLFINSIGAIILDGDDIRKTVNKDLTFSLEDREENNRRVAEIARIMNDASINVICALITPTNNIRKNIEKIIGKENFVLIYLNTPIEVCKSRDKKHLYQNAQLGNISNFTGISSFFEEPDFPDITLNGEEPLSKNLKQVMMWIKSKYHIKIKSPL